MSCEYTYHDAVDDDVKISVDTLPILAGIEAVVETKCHSCKVVLPAESGRAETSKESAAHMKDNFILHGPGERKEGGIPLEIISNDFELINRNTDKGIAWNTDSLPLIPSSPPVTLNLDVPNLADIINMSIGEINLLKEI